VLGVNHTSPGSAVAARELILREKPDVVVVELDSERFFHGLAVMEHVGIFEERHGQHEADNEGSSTLGALELFSKVPFTSDGPFNLLMLLDFHATRIKLAIAGGGPGTDGEEFLAAVRAAIEVGADIHLGDRDDKITESRRLARKERGSILYDKVVADARALAKEQGKSLPSSGFWFLFDPREWLATAAKVFAVGPTAAYDSFWKALYDDAVEFVSEECGFTRDEAQGVCDAFAKAWKGSDITMDEYVFLHRFDRAFNNNVIALCCSDDTNEEKALPYTKWDEDLGVHVPDELWQWSHRETIGEERDEILAHSITDAAFRGRHSQVEEGKGGHRKVVAIVGAAHVPGIKRWWDHMYHAPDESTFKARFTESCRRVDDYVQPVPSDAYPAAGTSERVGPVAVAGAFLFGGARSLGVRPRTVAAGVGATVAIVAGVGAIGLHYLVNGLERTVHVTERAAEKARESNVIPPRATHAQSVLEIIKAKEEATGRSPVEICLISRDYEGQRPYQSMGFYGDSEGAAAPPPPPRPKGPGESFKSPAAPLEAPIVSKFKSMLPKW
jgi:hypothetical protein